jgi:outer membrane protein assembly factor BamD
MDMKTKTLHSLKSAFLLTMTVLTALGLACTKPKPQNVSKQFDQSMTAPALLERGERELKRKKWEDGRATLKLIEEYLPSSEEFPRAKLLIADSYFYANKYGYAEAEVEYKSFLNYFPRHPQREYVLYRIALCAYAAIENGERDQTATFKAIEAFNKLIEEIPGSPYATDARARTNECWRRIAEHELAIGIFYVNVYQFAAAEKRLKEMLEAYPEQSNRERAYYYLGEALRRKFPSPELYEQEMRAFLESIEKTEDDALTSQEKKQWAERREAFFKSQIDGYVAEAKSYYQRLVESYPNSPWAGRARDRLLELGQTKITEELDG